jgi:hypothetical protein
VDAKRWETLKRVVVVAHQRHGRGPSQRRKAALELAGRKDVTLDRWLTCGKVAALPPF